MSVNLQPECRQTVPLGSLREEAALRIWRTASALQDEVDALLREHGISSAQYNVLRILRGAGLTGLCRNDIRDRLVARMPDVTRLLDRLETMEFVRRERGTLDRRLVTTYLTPAGERLLMRIDVPVATLHDQQFRHLEDHQVRTLIDLLTLAGREA
jgi:DNA-binding MarR family transcriptional regulator